MKPAHQIRRRAAVELAPVIYPDGFFTDPVRAWKQLAFVSAIQIDPRTKRYATDFQLAQKCRQAGGFDHHPLGLPGALTEPLREKHP